MSGPAVSAAAQRHAAAVMEAAGTIRLRELFGDPAGAIYHLADRHGISVTAVRTRALDHEQLVALMRYRLAQYLAIGFVDAERVYREHLHHEPLDHVAPDDVHVVAGDAETGELVCYAAMRSIAGAPPDATVRMRDRPLFPAEEVHGWGIYQRLRELPDIRVSRVRELGRFVKNQAFAPLDHRAIRGPIEVATAFFRLLGEELRDEIDAGVGDFEEGVAMQNFAYFHVPMAVLHGTVPVEPEDAWLHYRYVARRVYPFAMLTRELERSRPRLDAVDAALELPGRRAIAELLRLREDRAVLPSALVPPEGLPTLNDTEVLDQAETEMPARRAIVEAGAVLRAADVFSDLSVAEAAVLGTFMERVEVARGGAVVREGEPADALYVVETGRLEAAVGGTAVRTLEAGDVVGEIGLLADTRRTADVCAVSAATLLRLTREDYARFLGSLPDVELRLLALAAARLGDDGSVASLLTRLAPGEAARLGAHMARVVVSAGTVVVREGDAADAFYVIVDGEAAARAAGRGLRRLGPGDHFGEVALLAGSVRTADVVAETDLTLLRLDGAGFDAFLATSAEARELLGATARARAAGVDA